MIAQRFETFLLDLDGVVYVGGEPLPGAVDALRRLRETGKTLRFLTNDPRPTRREVVRRLAGQGIEARLDEVVTCGWVTAVHLQASGVRSSYVVGSEGLRAEIGARGVEVKDGGEVDAAVVGCDEHVGYPEIRRAARLILEGAEFIATNDDPTFPTPEGPAPATGTIVAAIRTASSREPRVLGKPHPHMFRVALDGAPGEAVMIGDSLATDIAGARALGIPALWLADDAQDGPDGGPPGGPVTPDARIGSLSALFDPRLSLP